MRKFVEFNDVYKRYKMGEVTINAANGISFGSIFTANRYNQMSHIDFLSHEFLLPFFLNHTFIL